MASERLSISDALGDFAPGQPLRAALFLTYCFDGRWFEEAIAPTLFDRPVTTTLLIRDRRALISEAPSVRYHRADAAYSTRVFHPKLALFVAEDRARAFVGSANMTRGGFEHNLELGSTFDLHPDGGCRSFFKSLLDYVTGPLRRETDGSGLHDLDDVASALREVIGKSPAEQNPASHLLLHNYERPLWEQLLKSLPHRVLRRAAIVSPFYEPDASAGRPEDPPDQSEDTSAFNRLFSDFEFDAENDDKPVDVYFQQDGGMTALPIVKLRKWEERLTLHARLGTSDDARRLHGKLIILEGAGRKGREPFLVALHGSPNFTSAALFSTPPDGNAELAVLTRLPTKGSGIGRVIAALGLSDLFGVVSDWNDFHTKPRSVAPLPSQDPFTLTDATLRVVGQTVWIKVRNIPPTAATFRLSVQIEGVWHQIAAGAASDLERLGISVPDLAGIDVATKLFTVRASRIRIEMLGEGGATLAADEGPLNVDCPDQFCGLAIVGPLILTLDQRIAQAGSGTPMSYRDQQNWLERRRRERGKGAGVVASHQADLDKLFRNLHTGLKGLRRRLEASPRSEFTLRNNLRQLFGWCLEAITPGGNVSSDECRAFLLDRLAREIAWTLGRVEKAAASLRLSLNLNDLGMNAAIEAALAWLSAAVIPGADSYVRNTKNQFSEVQLLLGQLERQP